MEETLEYWENIKSQREEDIVCQEAIGNPDRELMNILLRQLKEAKDKIEEISSSYSSEIKEKKLLIEKLEKDLYNETQSRKTTLSQKKSSEVRLGHIAEKLAPFLEDFPYNPEDAIFLGQPIDYIVFDDSSIVFVEIKTGKSKLSAKQRHIRDLVKNKYIEWKEIRIQ